MYCWVVSEISAISECVLISSNGYLTVNYLLLNIRRIVSVLLPLQLLKLVMLLQQAGFVTITN